MSKKLKDAQSIKRNSRTKTVWTFVRMFPLAYQSIISHPAWFYWKQATDFGSCSNDCREGSACLLLSARILEDLTSYELWPAPTPTVTLSCITDIAPWTCSCTPGTLVLSSPQCPHSLHWVCTVTSARHSKTRTPRKELWQGNRLKTNPAEFRHLKMGWVLLHGLTNMKCIWCVWVEDL